MAQKGFKPFNILKSIYQDDFQWSIVKSVGLFFLGVRLAKEFAGVEIMPPLAAPH